MDTFLSPEQLAELRILVDRGNATVQEFIRPNDPIKIRRYNKVTGAYLPHGLPIHPIKISFGLDDRTEHIVGIPIETDATIGRMKMWADDADVIVGDRFDWQGYVLEVVRIFPERLGTVLAQVELKQK